MAGGAIAGFDEAGRGAWAGPICAAAAVVHRSLPAEIADQIKDSKEIGESRREILGRLLRESSSVAYGLGIVDALEIDAFGLGWANREVFVRAAHDLSRRFPETHKTISLGLIDGSPINNPDFALPYPFETIIGGDGCRQEIAAASILAKTHRDALMRGLGEQFPGYGFAAHKGYGTRAHAQALETGGPIPQVHRLGVSPVAAIARAQNSKKTRQSP